jgi:hypothetical protein
VQCVPHTEQFYKGNDTTEHISDYDRSSAVSGVKATWVSGFVSGLAHHISHSKIFFDKAELKSDEISPNLEHFPRSCSREHF